MFNKEKPVEIIFDKDKCTNCGICAEACSGKYLLYKDDQVIINNESMFGCIQCGHCMINCPLDAIKVRGEGISENDIFKLKNNAADFDQLQSLLAKRRSIRKFKKQEVPREVIDQIIDAASTGAISIPPYEVKIVVINGADKVQVFADEIIKAYKKTLKIFNPLTLKLFSPIIGKNTYKMFMKFILPLINTIIDHREKGEDILFYNAPAVIVFYTTAIVESEDAIIASTIATTAAEALGLGSCYIGSVAPAINNNKDLKEKYGILKDEKAATALILGYPMKTFSKGIKRNFKEVKYF